MLGLFEIYGRTVLVGAPVTAERTSVEINAARSAVPHRDGTATGRTVALEMAVVEVAVAIGVEGDRAAITTLYFRLGRLSGVVDERTVVKKAVES